MQAQSTRFYTSNDFWLTAQDGVVTLGLTDFGQAELGELVFIELPTLGRQVAARQPFGIVESVKAVAELVAPVSGEVVEVNPEVPDNPSLVNDSPLEAGWLVRLKLATPLESTPDLLSEQEYAQRRGPKAR